MGLARLDGALQGGAVHPRHHQDPTRRCLLDDGWDQPVFGEFQLVKKLITRRALHTNPPRRSKPIFESQPAAMENVRRRSL